MTTRSLTWMTAVVGGASYLTAVGIGVWTVVGRPAPETHLQLAALGVGLLIAGFLLMLNCQGLERIIRLEDRVRELERQRAAAPPAI